MNRNPAGSSHDSTGAQDDSGFDLDASSQLSSPSRSVELGEAPERIHEAGHPPSATGSEAGVAKTERRSPGYETAFWRQNVVYRQNVVDLPERWSGRTGTTSIVSTHWLEGHPRRSTGTDRYVGLRLCLCTCHFSHPHWPVEPKPKPHSCSTLSVTGLLEPVWGLIRARLRDCLFTRGAGHRRCCRRSWSLRRRDGGGDN
jgi:hypothetical protein